MNRQLPFNAAKPPAEYRPLLDWGQRYDWPVPCQCSGCRREGNDQVQADCVVIKIPNGRMTLGYLYTLCPAHADRSKW